MERPRLHDADNGIMHAALHQTMKVNAALGRGPRRRIQRPMGAGSGIMTDGQGTLPPPDPSAIATDWLTIWQSELSAMITDVELQDTLMRLVAIWAETAARMARLMPLGPHDTAARPPGPATPSRPAAPVAASDDRDAAIRELAERVAQLERRLLARDSGPEDDSRS
jgi:hypothetical protein